MTATGAPRRVHAAALLVPPVSRSRGRWSSTAAGRVHPPARPLQGRGRACNHQVRSHLCIRAPLVCFLRKLATSMETSHSSATSWQIARPLLPSPAACRDRATACSTQLPAPVFFPKFVSPVGLRRRWIWKNVRGKKSLAFENGFMQRRLPAAWTPQLETSVRQLRAHPTEMRWHVGSYWVQRGGQRNHHRSVSQHAGV